jgi:hypothetical protein
MKHEMTLKHKFVKHIPDCLETGMIYVSIDYATVVHKCCCGCGNEVITPLSPTDWKLVFDGQSISLNPSIGNWSFACQSHYWIKSNKVKWDQKLSQEKINAGRSRDEFAKKRYFNNEKPQNVYDEITNVRGQREGSLKGGLLSKLIKWLFD